MLMLLALLLLQNFLSFSFLLRRLTLYQLNLLSDNSTQVQTMLTAHPSLSPSTHVCHHLLPYKSLFHVHVYSFCLVTH